MVLFPVRLVFKIIIETMHNHYRKIWKFRKSRRNIKVIVLCLHHTGESRASLEQASGNGGEDRDVIASCGVNKVKSMMNNSGQCGSVGLSIIPWPKDYRFNSGAGHVSGLQVQFLVWACMGGSWSMLLFCINVSLSSPVSLNPMKKCPQVRWKNIF